MRKKRNSEDFICRKCIIVTGKKLFNFSFLFVHNICDKWYWWCQIKRISKKEKNASEIKELCT